MNEIKTISEAINYLGNNLDYRDGLEQLAEECAELGQAALKLIRAMGMNSNPTPVTEEQAMQNIHEEIEDVINTIYVLGFTIPEPTESTKMIRWANRCKKTTQTREENEKRID